MSNAQVAGKVCPVPLSFVALWCGTLTRVFFLLVAFQSYGRAADIIAPTLTSFHTSQTSINTSLGDASVGVSFTASDDQSGVRAVYVRLISPSQAQYVQQQWSAKTAQLVVSGGVTLTLPEFSEAGMWTFSVSLVDYANNSRGLSASELAMLGPTQLTVVSAAPIKIITSPQGLVFNCLTGQSCTQNVLVTAATGSGTVYSISIDTSVGKWLTVSSSSGKMPSTVTVSANTSGLIAPGIYHGTLTITAPGAILATVPVTLNVNTGSTLNIAVPDPYWSPRFIYRTTGPPPSPQRITVSGQHYDTAAYQWKDQILAVTAEVVINGGSQNSGWLSVAPASASTPVSFAVTVNPLGLAPGVYNSSIKLTAPTADNSPLFMPVTLTVNQPAITAVLNGADFSRFVSPGSIATIFGQLLASTSQQAASVPLPLNLSGVSLKINPSTDSHGNWVGGMAAPLWYVGPDQINFEMPTDVSLGGTNAVLTTTSASGAVTTLWFTFQVQGTSLTIFTYGNNRAVVTRPDNSLVDIDHPARPGSMLTAYITGIGPLDNPVATNVTTPNQPLSRALLPTSATVGGKQAEIQFVGLTPGCIALAQANIVVPDLSDGDYPVVIYIQGVPSNAPMITISNH